MTVKCPKCQSDNPGTATFCADCGTQLPSIKDIEVTETLETPKEELTTGSSRYGTSARLPGKEMTAEPEERLIIRDE